MGFDPNEPMTIEEKWHWKELEALRHRCEESEDPFFAIKSAPYFDKQYFLGKWWDALNINEKAELLGLVWMNKGDGYLFGFNWWLPFFEEVGFITNCDAEIPQEPITLYRGSEEAFSRGMSWTPDLKVAEEYAYVNLGVFGDKKVFTTTVDPDAILAIFGGDFLDDHSGEVRVTGHEYVINHEKLKPENIREINKAEEI